MVVAVAKFRRYCRRRIWGRHPSPVWDMHQHWRPAEPPTAAEKSHVVHRAAPCATILVRNIIANDLQLKTQKEISKTRRLVCSMMCYRLTLLLTKKHGLTSFSTRLRLEHTDLHMYTYILVFQYCSERSRLYFFSFIKGSLELFTRQGWMARH